MDNEFLGYVMDKLQDHWEGNKGEFTKSHNRITGMRSSQIEALVSLLIEAGVINYQNIRLLTNKE